MTNENYIKEADAAYDEALEIVRSTDGWKLEKEDQTNKVTVEMKKNAKGKKIYRCKAKINIPASLLSQYIADTDNVCSWNKTLKESRLLEKITDNIGITYQVTTDAAGGMVSSRDFVYLYKISQEERSWVMGGKSTEYSEAPSKSGVVRAVNGPGLMMVTPEQDGDWCEVIWLMDCEYRGMMMQRILDMALPIAQTSYMECLRNLAKQLKSEGKF